MEEYALNAFLEWLQQLQFGNLIDPALTVAAAIICIVVHETCHGLTAYWLGDPTAKNAGRLTLNPLKHIDIAGLVLLAIVKFGWAKPVPINMRNFKNPKTGMAISALAGPVSNVLLALVALLVRVVLIVLFYNTGAQIFDVLSLLMAYIAIISTGLAVFNIIPVPPLDGSKVLAAILPETLYWKLMRYERYGMLLLIVLLFANVLDTPLAFLRDGLLDVLMWVTEPFANFMMNLLI